MNRTTMHSGWKHAATVSSAMGAAQSSARQKPSMPKMPWDNEVIDPALIQAEARKIDPEAFTELWHPLGQSYRSMRRINAIQQAEINIRARL
jgi:hypothetical protein